MTRRTDQLKLGAFLANSGHHVAAWRHPKAQADASLDFDYFRQVAQTAERGRFDALFVADVVALWGHHLDALSRTARGEHFEPLTLMAALAAVTSRIGLIATATTSYNEPYHIARKFAAPFARADGGNPFEAQAEFVGEAADRPADERHDVAGRRLVGSQQAAQLGQRIALAGLGPVAARDGDAVAPGAKHEKRVEADEGKPAQPVGREGAVEQERVRPVAEGLEQDLGCGRAFEFFDEHDSSVGEAAGPPPGVETLTPPEPTRRIKRLLDQPLTRPPPGCGRGASAPCFRHRPWSRVARRRRHRRCRRNCRRGARS